MPRRFVSLVPLAARYQWQLQGANGRAFSEFPKTGQPREVYLDFRTFLPGSFHSIQLCCCKIQNFRLNCSHFGNFIYLFIYLLFSHNKDYRSITLYKDVARGPQKTTRLVRGGPLVTIILSNRTITTHNNGQYKTHYRYSRKSKTFVLNDCNVKIEVTEFGKEFQILGPWNKIENCLVLVRQA